jgi:hypothetical protein
MNPIHYRPSARLLRTLLVIAFLCSLVFGAGLLTSRPERAWSGFLIGFALVSGLALAGAFFTSITHVANAHWAVVLRRIPEAMAGTLPLAFGLGILLLGGVPVLYSWAHVHEAHAPLLEHKLVWLNQPFFAVRMVGYFALWIWLAGRVLASSRAQDRDGKGEHSAAAYQRSILFIAVFAITFSLASWDWYLSLEPEWFSTIYALQALAGIATAGLGLVMIAASMLGRTRLAHALNENHFDDLGKLGIALSLFWVYISFCQYMLIWYTDMPEETVWYLARNTGAWKSLHTLGVVLNWLVPFCVLMPKRARRSSSVILRVGMVFLFGRVIDLWLLLGPPLMQDGPGFGPYELAPVLGMAALFAWYFLRTLARENLVPLGDPNLETSLHHHC